MGASPLMTDLPVQTLKKSTMLALRCHYNALPCHVISVQKNSRAATEALSAHGGPLEQMFFVCAAAVSGLGGTEPER